MHCSPILIVSGEPNSIFLELFFKIINKKKIKSPIILISSKKLLRLQMKKLGFKKKIRLLESNKINQYNLNNKKINLINIEYNQNEAFKKISTKSKVFIENSFKVAFELIKNNGFQ